MSNVTEPTPPRLDLPDAAQPLRIAWLTVTAVISVHVLALLALVPWLFSWTGLVTCLCGLYVFGTLGINLGYHRLLTHHGMTVPKWLEYLFATLGMCCLEDTPARWVAIHRMHHQHSDEQDDPHSPLVSFAWGHFGWVFTQNRDHDVILHYERYARDLLRDPFYMSLERGLWRLWIYLTHAALFFLAGLVVGWWSTGSVASGLRLGSSLLVWGVLLRTVLVWHITWSVNSIGHIWGYRNYSTADASRNNWLVALLSNGEGWHNNHHWNQRCAAHGHRWWEFDVTYWTIRFLESIGVARNVVHLRRDA